MIRSISPDFVENSTTCGLNWGALSSALLPGSPTETHLPAVHIGAKRSCDVDESKRKRPLGSVDKDF